METQAETAKQENMKSKKNENEEGKGGGGAGGGPLKLGDECISTRQNSSSTLYSSHLQDFNNCLLERGSFLVPIHPESKKCDDQNWYPTLQIAEAPLGALGSIMGRY